MTLPTNITLPLIPELIVSDNPNDLYDYMKTLVFNISIFLQQTNIAVNGSTQVYVPATAPFISYPFIVGSTIPGIATYTNTMLRVNRINLMNFVFFDITWSGHTGTGNLLITSPYFSQPTLQMPYVGIVESDGITYDAGYTYLTLNCIPNTNTIQVDENGSGLPLKALAIPASGHLRGTIIYAGQQYQ
jgi:hypothetical protein